MATDQTRESVEQSDEGPSLSTGGIVRSTLNFLAAKQSREGPKSGGMGAGSAAVSGKGGVMRKLDTKSHKLAET